jgi:hypothetical protein
VDLFVIGSLVVVVGSIAIAVLVYYISQSNEHQRARAWAQQAGLLQFAYSTHPDPTLLPAIEGIIKGRLRNVLYGDDRGSQFILADLYEDPGSESGSIRTICLIQDKDFHLPHFVLAEARWANRNALNEIVPEATFGVVAGNKTIAFDDDARFGDKFALYSFCAPEIIHAYFPEVLRDYLKGHLGRFENIIGFRDFYCVLTEERIPPVRCKPFLDLCLDLRDDFVRCYSQVKPDFCELVQKHVQLIEELIRNQGFGIALQSEPKGTGTMGPTLSQESPKVWFFTQYQVEKALKYWGISSFVALCASAILACFANMTGIMICIAVIIAPQALLLAWLFKRRLWIFGIVFVVFGIPFFIEAQNAARGYLPFYSGSRIQKCRGMVTGYEIRDHWTDWIPEQNPIGKNLSACYISFRYIPPENEPFLKDDLNKRYIAKWQQMNPFAKLMPEEPEETEMMAVKITPKELNDIAVYDMALLCKYSQTGLCRIPASAYYYWHENDRRRNIQINVLYDPDTKNAIADLPLAEYRTIGSPDTGWLFVAISLTLVAAGILLSFIEMALKRKLTALKPKA